jgi:hypothetical protein
MLRTYLVCREKQEREREAHSVLITNDPITSTSELLLRQNSITAQVLRLAADHCAIENYRPQSAVRPILAQHDQCPMGISHMNMNLKLHSTFDHDY